MQTKLSQLKAAYAAGDMRKALAIAARFPELGAERDAIKLAHEAYTHPGFYAGLGMDEEALKARGAAALKDKYKLGF